MLDQDFKQFESDLLRVGIAPRHVRRTATELREHFDDLVAAEMRSGSCLDDARHAAAEQFGDLQDIAAAMRACPELRSWSYRFPRVAVVVYPLTYLALLPVVPLFAGVAHAPQLARWGACLLLGGAVTVSIMMLLQVSIAYG